jgi:hypothetical protein
MKTIAEKTITESPNLPKIAAAAFVLGFVAIAACVSVPDEHRQTYVGPLANGQTLAPDFNLYKAGVDNYLGRRCATLDCHGQLGRGLRLFSQNGLRAFDAAGAGFFPLTSGKEAVSDDEVTQNYLAVVGLEPEVMTQVMAGGGADPLKLLLLKKPLLYEGHKGGQVMVDNSDPGYKCIASWLAGALDQDSCNKSVLVR